MTGSYASMVPVIVRFDEFEFHLRSTELFINGRPVKKLTPQPGRVLGLLICHAVERPDNRLVSRKEIEEKCWDVKLAVIDDAINRSVQTIRECLHDDLDHPRFIEVERGRGVRFIASIEGIEWGDGPPPPPTDSLIRIPRFSWDPERRPPGALLQAECADGVPFHGRGKELEDLEAWCQSESTVGVRLYTAAGGMGKTRLLLELSERLAHDGWRAGFLTREAQRTNPEQWAALVELPQALFLVVDYAETRRQELLSLLRLVVKTSTRVRLCLLARATGDWWDEIKREGDGVGDLLRGPATRWHTLQPLVMTTEARGESFQTAVRTFAHQLGQSIPSALPEDFDAPHFDRVLLLHMAALAAVDGVVVKGDEGILDYVLKREHRFWSRQLETAGLPLLEKGVAQAMAVLTLRGGAHARSHAVTILRDIPQLRSRDELELRRIADILHEAYPGERWIEPVLPDLLGEQLLDDELDKDVDGELITLVFGSPDEDESGSA